MELNFRKLRADEVEARPKQITEKGAIILLYKNARCDMNLLDETLGAFNWQCDYKEIKGNMYCGVGIKDPDTNEWIWKWDCGTESNQDGEKGEASDSFKRACFRVGIGRELYTGPFIFYPMSQMKDKNDKFKVTNLVYANERIQSVTISDITNGTQKTFSHDVSIIEAEEIKPLEDSKVIELQNLFRNAGFTDINSLCGKYKHSSLTEFSEADYLSAKASLNNIIASKRKEPVEEDGMARVERMTRELDEKNSKS